MKKIKRFLIRLVIYITTHPNRWSWELQQLKKSEEAQDRNEEINKKLGL